MGSEEGRESCETATGASKQSSSSLNPSNDPMPDQRARGGVESDNSQGSKVVNDGTGGRGTLQRGRDGFRSVERNGDGRGLRAGAGQPEGARVPHDVSLSTSR